MAREGVLIIITRYHMVLCIFAPNLSGYQKRENTYLSIHQIDLFFFFQSPLRSFHNALLPTLGITCFSSNGKASVCNAGDLGSIPGLGRSPGEGNGSPLQ